MNPSGMTRSTIKYGYVYGPRTMVGPNYMTTSEVFDDTGAKFIKLSGSADGYFNVLDGGDEVIFGWAEVGGHTCSSTVYEGVMVDVSCESVYYIPSDIALTIALDYVGKTGETSRSGSVVSYDPTNTSTGNNLLCVGIDIANQAVYVKINPTVQNEVASVV